MKCGLKFSVRRPHPPCISICHTNVIKSSSKNHNQRISRMSSSLAFRLNSIWKFGDSNKRDKPHAMPQHISYNRFRHMATKHISLSRKFFFTLSKNWLAQTDLSSLCGYQLIYFFAIENKLHNKQKIELFFFTLGNLFQAEEQCKACAELPKISDT